MTRKYRNRNRKTKSKNIKGSKKVKRVKKVKSRSRSKDKIGGAAAIGKAAIGSLSKIPSGYTPFIWKEPSSYVKIVGEAAIETVYAGLFAFMSLLNIPFTPLDQFIPSELCKKLFGKDKIICESTFGEYAFSGINNKKPKLIPEVSACSQSTGTHITMCKPKFQTNNQTNNQKGGQKGGWDKNENYQIVLDKIIKINLYLRRYEDPYTVMEEIIERIFDIEVINKMINIYNYFTKGIESVTGNLEQCDQDLFDKASGGTINESQADYKLKKCGVEADMLYLDFDRSKEECPGCGKFTQFLKVVSQYSRLSTSALFGEQNQDDMFAIVNIIYLVIFPKLEQIEQIPDEIKGIIQDIGIIFSNINCRCKILELMEKRVATLNSKTQST
uniref:Uncharacterized protein n=1 Tax=viral metagenome TaxID=1070528 RepID=A0A6C0EU98_9ZZZZ